MRKPTVSFVVPCYRLAHLLPDCIRSILSQSYGDLEVVIMDDCSPDHTADVAHSFDDPRVRHIRNDTNLGHLLNYNKGIALSRGAYVWLISADDYLGTPFILQRYVDVMERHPRVGYVFCPGYAVRDGAITRLLGRYSQRGDRNRILRGHALLKRLLQGNFVLCPSGMVRRECYDKVGMFDVNFPWCGDWYLWCLFALYYDVAYLAEPMLCYRDHHDLSMTTRLRTEKLDACAAEEIAVPWMIRMRAQQAGYQDLARECLSAVGRTYGRVIASEAYRGSTYFMNFGQFEASLRRYAVNEDERDYVRARVAMSVGNELYWQGKPALARRFYREALKQDPSMVTVHLKNLLLSLGTPGQYVRKTILAFR